MDQFPYTLLCTMGSGLLKAEDNIIRQNVIFVCSENRELYASSAILSERSDYFKTSTYFRILWLIIVFTSGFQEGICAMRNGTTSDHHRIINMPEDFDAFYNILYYMYTGIIVFESSPELFEPANNAPKAVDVHLIYAAADRFLLGDLREKAALFLVKPCTIDNVTSRLFGMSDGFDSSGVAEYYEFYFQDNLEAVLRSSDYKNFFQEVEGWSPTERAEVNTRFRKLTTDRLTETEKDSEARKRKRRRFRLVND